MIAVDSSVIIDYLQGVANAHTEQLQHHLASRRIILPPAVVTELFSSPKHYDRLGVFLDEIYQLEIYPGYWERAGKNRAKLKARSLKAKTADALIAQSCIDHDIPLLTRDPDFRHYVKLCGLKLAIAASSK